MKVLVNGGLNLSELDGWWVEAYSPEVGWALRDGCEHTAPDWDAREAETLYGICGLQWHREPNSNAQRLLLRPCLPNIGNGGQPTLWKSLCLGS
jgi:hypothetical protein